MTQRTAGWALLIGMAIMPLQAQDAFHGCTGHGWDCKAQSKHPEVFNRPLLLPELEGPYRVVAHTPLDPKTCQAHLDEVKEKGVSLLPEFPQVPVTAVTAPGLTGWAVRTGAVDEVWLCTGGNQVVLVPWGPQGDQVRLTQAEPGALDPPLPPVPLDPPVPDLGEMAVAASSELTIVCQDGSRWSDVHSAEACAERGGVSAWIVSEAPSPLIEDESAPSDPVEASSSAAVTPPTNVPTPASSPVPGDKP